MRKIIGEDLGGFVYRLNTAIKKLREETQVRAWDEQYQLNRFVRVGYVGGLGKLHKTRMTYKVLQYKTVA